jgi:RluA family pseudouridine synthase
MTTLSRRVAAEDTEATLLSWLVAHFRYFDAEAWQAAIVAGAVTRNGARSDANTCLAAGDRIAWTPPVADIAPVAIPVLHDDDDLLVVDKPAWLVVQADTAFPAHSLPFHLRRQLSLSPDAMLEPAHRLDRETSGVLVFARNLAAARHCQRQFEDGAVAKRYTALVRGEVAWERRVVDAAIGSCRGSALPHRRAVVHGAARGVRSTVSEFMVRERLRGATLLAAMPQTGRTHQLRVHLEHLGHPLLGDSLYGVSEDEALAANALRKAGQRPTTRHLLHADELRLPGIRGDGTHVFTAPAPPDMLAAIAERRGT